MHHTMVHAHTTTNQQGHSVSPMPMHAMKSSHVCCPCQTCFLPLPMCCRSCMQWDGCCPWQHTLQLWRGCCNNNRYLGCLVVCIMGYRSIYGAVNTENRPTHPVVYLMMVMMIMMTTMMMTMMMMIDVHHKTHPQHEAALSMVAALFSQLPSHTASTPPPATHAQHTPCTTPLLRLQKLGGVPSSPLQPSSSSTTTTTASACVAAQSQPTLSRAAGGGGAGTVGVHGQTTLTSQLVGQLLNVAVNDAMRRGDAGVLLRVLGCSVQCGVGPSWRSLAGLVKV